MTADSLLISQFDALRPGSVIELYEGGVLRSCWDDAWTAA